MLEVPESESDIDLWERISKDDEAAFKVLFQRYWSLLYTTLFYYIKDKDGCADVVHDIFISLWNRRHRLEIFSFKYYLTHAARYMAYKYLKANDNYEIELTPAIEYRAGFSNNDADIKFTNEVLEQKLNKHLKDLPQRCREIFLLSRKDFLTNDEIALQLKISKRTVENQLTFALRHLRYALNDILQLLVLLSVINMLL